MGKKTDALEVRIAALEERVQELERCTHEDHTIGGEAVLTIAALVKADIAQLLLPAQQESGEKTREG